MLVMLILDCSGLAGTDNADDGGKVNAGSRNVAVQYLFFGVFTAATHCSLL